MGYIKEEKERSLKQLNIYKPSEISRFFLVLNLPALIMKR